VDARRPFARSTTRGGRGDYRRWAFESAALDLGLGSRHVLADVLERPYVRAVRRLDARDIEPFLALKSRPRVQARRRGDWDRALMERLAATGRVRVLDSRRLPRDERRLAPDPALYRAVVESFPTS